jgi:ParB family chromosome partitioning protein
MDLQIPLNKLRFGHEAGEGINARVTGRDDGIAALAANIHANGQIENLIVKEIDGGLYAVANGNRRLAAFHMIYTPESDQPIGCTLHDVDGAKAFEFSLATAITAQQLHPVDQYEAFAKLSERGQSADDIALHYGMTVKQVRQALALGGLSGKIRDAWRKGEIKAEVAKAFTLAPNDYKRQDKVFAELARRGTIYESWVKQELGANATAEDVAQLLDFVGAEAFRAAGGHVTEDLFGRSHIFFEEADVTLLKQMARRALDAECERLKADGWGWAEIGADLPHGAQFWDRSQPKKPIYEGDEEERFKKLRARLAEIDALDESDYEIETEQDRLAGDVDTILAAVSARSFDEKQKKKLGCIVNVSAGRLFVLYGVKRPAEAAPPADTGDDAPSRSTKSGTPAKPIEPAPEEDISQALIQRLKQQAEKAAGTALIQDEQLALSLLLAGLDAYSGAGIRVSAKTPGGPGKLLGADGNIAASLALARKMKPAERIALLAQVAAGALDFVASSHEGQSAIVDAIDAKAFNAAARGAFDAKDYFNGVSKKLCLKAIEEALGPDLARQQTSKSKAEIAAFALQNVPPTGWLPVQLRAKGYDGPPLKPFDKAWSEAPPKTTRAAVKKAKAARETSRNERLMKRAAAAKRSAKKTGKRRR